MHDITGHYNRFDVFDLHVNRRSLQPAVFHDPASNVLPALLEQDGALDSVADARSI